MGLKHLHTLNLRNTTNAARTIVNVQGAVGKEAAGLQVRVGGEPLAGGGVLADLQAGVGIADVQQDADDLADAGAWQVADLYGQGNTTYIGC